MSSMVTAGLLLEIASLLWLGGGRGKGLDWSELVRVLGLWLEMLRDRTHRTRPSGAYGESCEIGVRLGVCDSVRDREG